jgi:ABC-type lipoprotein release transport system permease subunit
MLLALFIGSLISVVASIAPAYWAARKEPVEAMRVEE